MLSPFSVGFTYDFGKAFREYGTLFNKRAGLWKKGIRSPEFFPKQSLLIRFIRSGRYYKDDSAGITPLIWSKRNYKDELIA